MPEDASARHLVLTGDPVLFAIVRLSLLVSLSAVMFAPLIALTRFHGREIAIACSDGPEPTGKRRLSTALH